MEQCLQSLIPWGTQALLWIQSHTDNWLQTFFIVFTYLGYEAVYLILLPLLYWCIHKRIGIALVYLALLSAWVNDAIKYVFRLPRPLNPDLRIPLPETTPSFPSGHAQNAVADWGYVAYRFRNRILTVVAILLMILIGLSRLVLGVHFPQDVIGGWLIGLLLLILYAWLEPPVAAWLDRQPLGLQLAAALALPAALVFMHPASLQGRYPTEAAITIGATLAGVGLGIPMERAWVRFRVAGEWWRRGLRYLLGLAIMAILYIGPKLLLPADLAYGPEAAIRFVRYALLGWTAAFLCPWFFVRLRLASQDV